MTKLFSALAALLLFATAAQAQSAIGGGSSGRMWGAAASSLIGSGADSSLMHTEDATNAGQVNAAKNGLLYGGANITITAIGSQNIVSTSVYGNNNTTNVNANQTSSNSGNVTNNGTIAPRP